MNWGALPIIGWIIGPLLAISSAIPLWFVWSYCGLGGKYFHFIPELYHYIPFWDMVGLFLIVWVLKSLVPNIASNNNTNTNN
jgi:hypothetical protein